MTALEEYQRQLAGNLKARVQEGPGAPSDSDLRAKLVALIDSWPDYGNKALDAAHRAALVALLETNLPDLPIAAQPAEGGPTGTTKYEYTGVHSGYAEAFFPMADTFHSACTKVGGLVQGVNSNLNGVWWGKYCVALLTAAVSGICSISVDQSKLNTDLQRFHEALKPALAASYLGVFPTAALDAIVSAGQGHAASALLASEIEKNEFTANINKLIESGGESAVAAVWFLFNLWITLKALGTTDVDAIIGKARSAGLIVPGEVGPGNWWNGGYTIWYKPLAAADIADEYNLKRTLSETMGVKSTYMAGLAAAHTEYSQVKDGYALSLCVWGPLSFYKPS